MGTTQYREVKRKAAVGERIKIVAKPYGEDVYTIGDVITVDGADEDGVIYANVAKRSGNTRGMICLREYVVLEPAAPAGFAESPAPASPLSADPLYAAFRQFVADNADGIRAILPDLQAVDPAPLFTIADGKLAPIAPKLTRAAVIAKATADVAELTDKMRGGTVQNEGNAVFRQQLTVPEFHVNRTKRVVTVLVHGECSGEIRAKFTAKCSPADVFHAEIGKAIALRKALGLTVPTEYTDAPQPDKAEVGAVVLLEGYRVTARPNTERGMQYTKGTAHVGAIAITEGTITDDTDVDYGAIVTEGAAA